MDFKIYKKIIQFRMLCVTLCLAFLFVRLNKLCLAWGLSVCPSVQVMFGMGFVCLSICTSYVWHGVCLFVRLYKLCLAWGLSVCPSVQVMFGMGFVCLSVCTSYVWHGVCLCVSVCTSYVWHAVCPSVANIAD